MCYKFLIQLLRKRMNRIIVDKINTITVGIIIQSVGHKPVHTVLVRIFQHALHRKETVYYFNNIRTFTYV